MWRDGCAEREVHCANYSRQCVVETVLVLGRPWCRVSRSQGALPPCAAIRDARVRGSTFSPAPTRAPT